MRFPWLQVDSDFIGSRSRDLAGMLEPVAGRKTSRREAMGMMLDLWTWALGRVSPDSPPDGLIAGANAPRLIASAIDWDGDPGLLVDAMEAAGLASWEHTGVRLKGFDRYVRTWEKNTRRRPSAGDDGAAGAAPPPDRQETGAHVAGKSPEPARKTQTHTEIKKEDSYSASQTANKPATSGSAQAETTDKPKDQFRLEQQEAKKPPRKPSAAERLFTTLERSRQEHCRAQGAIDVPEEWTGGRINKQLGKHANGTPQEKDLFEHAWGEWLADEKNGNHDPPWSIGYFMAALSTYMSRAARAKAAEETGEAA